MEDQESLTEALADRYQIEREIGSGGMATVYLAEDLKHHRRVAMKVLRPELAAALGPDRFLREIEIAAQLQHPNILPLLDSGEAGGFLFYVMPYVEGQSLREKLAAEGELPIGDAVRILRDVVDALTEAHAKGVVHRDIKPENILLSGRHALVADFGVAKAVSEATGRDQLTTAGVALGTPAYMAPEQASADPHLDQRVDIYAVGAVAYELLTGRPVFMGTTPQMILAAHMTEAPQPVTKHRDTVPTVLESLVARCLEKRPADRFQSAEELLSQLEALATPSGEITPTGTRPIQGFGSTPHLRLVTGGLLSALAISLIAVVAFFVRRIRGPGAGDASIAVLYFEDLTRDSADAYLIDGLTEDLATSLGRVEHIQVKAPGAVRRAQRAQGDDVVAIGNSLQVRYVLEGSFRRAGDGLRIVARLVDPRTEVTEWTDTYDLSTSEMLSLPSEIAADVTASVIGELNASERARVGRRLTDNPEAYDAYLRGNFRFARRDSRMLTLALDDYERAIQLDPTFSAARARIAMSYALMYDYGWVPDSIDAEALINQGLAITDSLLDRDPDLADAWHAKSMLSLYAGQHIDESLAAIERAVAIAPDHVEAHNLYGWLLLFCSRFSESERQAEIIRDLDPGWWGPFNQLGFSALYQGQLERAETFFDSTLVLAPTFATAHAQRARVRVLLGDSTGAMEDASSLARLGSSQPAMFIQASVDAMAGRRARAQHLADSLMASDDSGCLWPARLLLALGENEQALGLLEGCVPELDGETVADLLAPEYDPLKEDPRFLALVRWK